MAIETTETSYKSLNVRKRECKSNFVMLIILKFCYF